MKLTAKEIRYELNRGKYYVYLAIAGGMVPAIRLMDAKTRKGKLHVRKLWNGEWTEVNESDRFEFA